MQSLQNVIKDFRSRPLLEVFFEKDVTITTNRKVAITFSHPVGDSKCHSTVSLLENNEVVEIKSKSYPISSPDEAYKWIVFTVDQFATKRA